MGCSDALIGSHALFGSTDRAGGIPGALVPSHGPVYLEGRLVLSLSFQGDPVEVQAEDAGGLVGRCPSFQGDPVEERAVDPGELIERYRLWDDLAEDWYGGASFEILRFEHVDIVVCEGCEPPTLWMGGVGAIGDAPLDASGLSASWKGVAEAAAGDSLDSQALSRLWMGAVDTRARVVPVPDLNGEGMEANGVCDLCWRRV